MKKRNLKAFLERTQDGNSNSKLRNTFISKDGTELYRIGMIDYLQKWNLQKKAERILKKLDIFENSNDRSVVEPVFYAKRWH